jgi:hypothetical protein
MPLIPGSSRSHSGKPVVRTELRALRHPPAVVPNDESPRTARGSGGGGLGVGFGNAAVFDGGYGGDGYHDVVVVQ